MARSEQEIEAEQQRSRRRMLEAEGALLLLLLRRARPLASDWRPGWDPAGFINGVAIDVMAGRRVAATASLSELRVSAMVTGFEVPQFEPAWGVDIRRAERAARGFALNLQRHVALAGLDDVADAAADAAKWAARHAELTAATETAQSWNTIREQAIREAVAAHRDLRFELFKVWDATLDKRTCPVCERAHGTLVLAEEDFPDGVPGNVHPRCRCQEHFLRRDEVDLHDYSGSGAIQ